jgi:hypothetical protein
MRGYFLNSRTAIFEADHKELKGTEQEVEKLAKLLYQYGNVTDFEHRNSFGSSKVTLEIRFLDDVEKFASRGQEDREPDNGAPLAEFTPDEQERLNILKSLQERGSDYLVEKETGKMFRILGSNQKKNLFTDKTIYTLEGEDGAKVEVPVSDIQKRFIAPSGGVEDEPEDFKKENKKLKEIDPLSQTNKYQTRPKEVPAGVVPSDITTEFDPLVEEEMKKKLPDANPLTGETYDDADASSLPAEEEEDEAGPPIEGEDEDEDITQRIIDLGNREKQRREQEEAPQKQEALEKRKKDQEAFKQNKEQESIQELGKQLQEELAAENKQQSISRLKSRKQYVDQIPQNQKIVDALAPTIATWERNNGRRLNDESKKKTYSNFIDRHPEQFSGLDKNLFLEWLDKSKPPKQEEIGVTAFTFDQLLDLGFSHRIAYDLGALPVGVEQKLVDTGEGTDTGVGAADVTVKKVMSQDGTELFVINDPSNPDPNSADGQKAVSGDSGAPELAKMEEKDMIPVEALTKEQREKLAQLGFTI